MCDTRSSTNEENRQVETVRDFAFFPLTCWRDAYSRNHLKATKAENDLHKLRSETRHEDFGQGMSQGGRDGVAHLQRGLRRGKAEVVRETLQCSGFAYR